MSALMKGAQSASLLVFSRHAARRVRQRGLRDRDVELVLDHGTPVAGDGVILLNRDAEREITRRKKEIQALDRLRGCKVVLSDGTIVTCYHREGNRVMKIGRKRRTKGQS